MELINIVSSNIDKIGWEANIKKYDDGGTYNILRIVYSSGKIYDYLNVPEELFKEMLKVESKGSFFWRKIKDKYLCSRVDNLREEE
jgi:hypothetical protein